MNKENKNIEQISFREYFKKNNLAMFYINTCSCC
jgi:hypothetical protein